MTKKMIWIIIAIVELIISAVVILLDFFIPTIIILVLMAVSLIIRHEHIHALGFKRPKSWPKLIGFTFVGVIFLQLFDIGIVMPILNRLTGTTIDYSGFSQLKGNVSQLLTFLILSWTLAALGEEIVYRGYLQKLLSDILGKSISGVILTIAISSLLFGLAHTEQGLIGVVVTTIDAIFYSWLKWKQGNNLWAAIIAHGLYNSIGMIIFFFVGPIYGLW